MKHLEPYLKTPIFQILDDEISLQEFEKWVYAAPELEIFLREYDYK